MRAPAPVLVLVIALGGLGACSATASPAEPGIAGRTAVVPEERSTCEALGRVDLAVVATDELGRERSAAALDDAEGRAPGDVRPALGPLADAYRRSADAARHDPRRSVVVTWVNSRCGGVR